MKARKSIFVPKKADLRNKRDIDFSGVDLHGNSDDEDEDSGPVDIRDADSFFNLPSDGGSGDEQP